jgi:recombination protein RecA
MPKEKKKEVAEVTPISNAASGLDPERAKRLAVALATIDKNHGKHTIFRLGIRPALPAISISTGSLGLDLALGVGGLPRGTITEIYGPPGSGKTTLALQTIASAQSNGGVAAFIDAEHALDTPYAQALEVNINELLLSQPDSGEAALNVLQTLIESRAIDVVVIDSVAALTPLAEIQGEVGDTHMGLQARLMSQSLRKLSPFMGDHQNGPLIIFINQLRKKIGVMFGSPETTTGGEALKFYTTVRLDVRRIGAAQNEESKEDENTISAGNSTRVKVVKNKVAPPFKQCIFDIIFGKGVDRDGELITLADQFEVIEKAGSWYSFDGNRLGQGRDNVKTYLKRNADIRTEIYNRILEKAKT